MPIPAALEEDEVGAAAGPTAEEAAADALESLALRLDVYWLAHGGTYTGARRAPLGAGPGAEVLRAAGSGYCIQAPLHRGAVVKRGPAAQLRLSSRRGAAACLGPTRPLDPARL